jgi:hypothetical protein
MTLLWTVNYYSKIIAFVQKIRQFGNVLDLAEFITA